MTARTFSKAPRLCTTALAFVIASSFATAKADPGLTPNIPAAEQKSANPERAPQSVPPSNPLTPSPTDPSTPRPLDPSVSELPLPYAPWQAAGFAPPTAPPAQDLPPPLARPRQQARRPLEVSAALAAFLPSCGSGSVDDRGCLTLGAGSGVDLALLYRPGPFFAFGAEAAVSGFARSGESVLRGAGGGARFFGVVGRVYFADEGAWDPYVALTLGAGKLDLSELGDQREATTGFGARVAGGIDYAFASRLRLGPAASFTHWVAWSEARCGGAVCRDERAVYGRLLGFATLGLRVTASFGDVL